MSIFLLSHANTYHNTYTNTLISKFRATNDPLYL